MIKRINGTEYHSVMDEINNFILNTPCEVHGVGISSNLSKTRYVGTINYSPVPHVVNVHFPVHTTEEDNSFKELDVLYQSTLGVLNSLKEDLASKGYDSTVLVATIQESLPITTRTVSYNSDGGSAVASEEVDYNTAATEPADPTKTGHTFVSWLKDGSEFDFASLILEDTTLVADWDINSYTITFNLNGGAIGADEGPIVESLNYGADQSTVLFVPIHPTLTFEGWYTDETLTVAFVPGNQPANNVVVYANYA